MKDPAPAEPIHVDPQVQARVRLECTYCHDGLDGAAVHCADCLAPHHAACFSAHGTCSAPGCAGAAWVRKRRPGRARKAAAVAFASGLGLLAATALNVAWAKGDGSGPTPGELWATTPPVVSGPLAVTAELEQTRVFAAREPVHLVVRLQGEEPQEPVDAPVRVVLAVDVSGSMQGEKIAFARQAVASFARGLRPEDRCAVIAFNGQASLLADWFRGGVSETPAWVDGLQAGGGTNILGAIQAAEARFGSVGGCKQDPGVQQAAGLERIVVLTDGRGSNPDAALVAQARRLAEQGIGLSLHGFGGDVNAKLLSGLAETGGGQYLFVDSGGMAVEAFDRELASAQQTVARSTELRIEPAPGVVVEKVVSWQARREGREHVVRVGDVRRGQERKVVVRLRWSNPDGAGEIPMARVRWSTQAVGGGGHDGQASVSARRAGSPGEALASVRPHLVRYLADARFADSMEHVSDLLVLGRFEEAKAVAQGARERFARERPDGLAELKEREFVTSHAVRRFYETGEFHLESADQVIQGGALPVGK